MQLEEVLWECLKLMRSLPVKMTMSLVEKSPMKLVEKEEMRLIECEEWCLTLFLIEAPLVLRNK